MKTGIPLQPIKMRLQPLKPRTLSHIPQNANVVYNQMRIKESQDKIKSKRPANTHNIVGLTDPVERVKIYRQKDFDEEAERQRKIRWNLIDPNDPNQNQILITKTGIEAGRQKVAAMSVLSACDSKIDLVNP